jgi:putative acetyltransferase
MAEFTIVPGDFHDARVIALLRVHVARAQAETGRGSSHALDAHGLQSPGIRFWTIWDGGVLLGFGALKTIGPDHCEIKSMHIAEGRRGEGAGNAMLDHLVAQAKAAGCKRISLETGSWEYFRPARMLYARHGFEPSGPFGDYTLDPNSVFMTMQL